MWNNILLVYKYLTKYSINILLFVNLYINTWLVLLYEYDIYQIILLICIVNIWYINKLIYAIKCYSIYISIYQIVY